MPGILGIGTVITIPVSIIWIIVTRASEPLFVVAMSLLYGVFGFIYLYATSEGILVFWAIEENTRRICTLLEEREQASNIESDIEEEDEIK
jgi:hypothetical protein